MQKDVVIIVRWMTQRSDKFLKSVNNIYEKRKYFIGIFIHLFKVTLLKDVMLCDLNSFENAEAKITWTTYSES